ncbi:hypothetical protein [Streptomyces sp. NPDC047315]|uniref:hypothetical protein n=1 Tax=Streptomyces sp. NPDC047315 TaxID=3155142 RepID=UPI0033C840ED
MLRAAARRTAALLHRAAYALWARYPADANPTGPRPRCVTFKLDKVVHWPNKGWQGGKMYGPIVPGNQALILDLLREGTVVAVRTQRTNLTEVAEWLEGHGIPAVASNGEPIAYWTDTTRVLVTDRELTTWAEVTPYGVESQDPEQIAQHLKNHVGARTAHAVARAILLPHRMADTRYRYDLVPSKTDGSCTLTMAGLRHVDGPQFHDATEAHDQEALDAVSEQVTAERDAQLLIEEFQAAGLTVDGTTADLRTAGVRLTIES